jgi:membrane protein implicated in regulation of membrane protease activity
MNWIFWLVLVIVLSFVEIATVSLVSIWFVASGIVAMILSFFIEDTAIITTIFILLGIFLLVISRPIVNKLRSKDNEKTNLDRTIGETAIVTEDIKKNVVGEVKVDGKRWSAVSKEKCLKGDTVKVLKIDGVKLIVEKESEK